MASLLAKQPFNTIYITFLAIKTLALTPWLVLRYGAKSSRPFPQWSLAAYIVTRLLRENFAYKVATRTSGLGAVESSQRGAKERFREVQPGPASLYTGPLTPGAIKPIAVGGIWYPHAPVESPGDNEKVVLHFTGGAFVMALGHDDNGKQIFKVLIEHTQATLVFNAQYRPASNSQTRFPAALQDVVTFYDYILSTGIKPSNVFISGDSAGGNLVIGFLRYLEAYTVLPKPAGAMLWSPFVEVTKDVGHRYENYRNSQHDLLIGSFLQWGAEAYYPEGTVTSDQTTYISPLHNPFRTTVPLWAHSGLGEALHDSISEFIQEMSAVGGNVVRLYSTEATPHDLLLAFPLLGLKEQVNIAMQDAHNYFKGKTVGS